MPTSSQHPPIPRLPASPRRQLPRRFPLVLALTWLSLDPTTAAGRGAGPPYFNPGSPLEAGLVQRVFVGPHFTDVFAGSLLPVSRDPERWTRFSFPYGLEPPSRGDSTATEGTLFGGGRALAGGRFRHAARAGDGALFEAAGHYLRGTDWPFADPVEERLRESNAFLPARDDQLERWGARVRYDLRPDDSGGWVFEGGLDRLRGNQAHRARRRLRPRLDPLGRAGALPPRPPVGRRPGARARGRGGRVSTAPPGISRTSRSSSPAGIDHSTRLGDRQTFLYGLDLRNTRPITDGTITGVYEDADDILVAGGYLNSVTRISSRLDLAAFVQLERHSRVDGPSISPFVNLIFRPADGHRFVANAARIAFMPSADHLVLDGGAGKMTAGVLIYDLMARGVPEGGFTFNDRCPGGYRDLCMRSPLAPGRDCPQTRRYSGIRWSRSRQPAIPWRSDPCGRSSGTRHRESSSPGSSSSIRRSGQPAGLPSWGRRCWAVPSAWTPSIRSSPASSTRCRSNTGSKWEGRGRLSATIGRSSIDNFIGPLRVETPTVFFEPASTRAFIEKRVEPMVRLGIVFPALRDLLIHDLTNLVLQVPVGTIMPDQVATPGAAADLSKLRQGRLLDGRPFGGGLADPHALSGGRARARERAVLRLRGECRSRLLGP